MMNKNGFIALFSVIIISAILVLTAVTLSFSGFYGRFNILDTESKERSNALADACIDSARLAISTDSYTLGTTVVVPVGSQSCTYTIDNNDQIVASGSFNDTYAYYYVQVDTTDGNLAFTDFKECPTLSPCP